MSLSALCADSFTAGGITNRLFPILATIIAISLAVPGQARAPEPILEPEPVLLPEGSAAGLCEPFGLVRLDFDETTRPGNFLEATALHTDYRLQGLLFSAPGAQDGGAVLNHSIFPAISGYSGENFLAFDTSAALLGGGKPVPPETLYFPGGASYVSLRAASVTDDNSILVMEAFTLDGESLGTEAIILYPSLNKLLLSVRGISRVEIRTTATTLVIDDLAFTPGSYFETLSFDEATRPAEFINATALRNDYQETGVVFSSPGAKDGGAVLDGMNFAVSGTSPPNLLAFDASKTLSGGGVPRPPVQVAFSLPVESFTLFAASPTGTGAGSSITLQAYAESGSLIGEDSAILSPVVQPLNITVPGGEPGITRVVIDSPAQVLVVDDLLFTWQNAVEIDFDDVIAPQTFLNATALRNQYEACGMRFSGPGIQDGGAILNDSSLFDVFGHSPENYLAFRPASILSNGGIPQAPETIDLTNPASCVVLFIGGDTDIGEQVTLQAFDEHGALLGTDSLTQTARLQPLRILSSGIRRVVVDSTGGIFVLDNLVVVFEPVMLYLPVILYSP